MATLTQSYFPCSNACIITKKHNLSTVIVVAKVMNRVVIFDALSGIVDKSIIIYVSKELDSHNLQKKFFELIGKMTTKDVSNKYFTADYDNLSDKHLSRGHGSKDMNPLDLKKLEKQVAALRFSEAVDNAINELIK